MKIAAIVPMRHASERVIGKNYRDFAGRPLFHHILRTLLNCPSITEVCVDTDSPVITDDVAGSFPAVSVLLRPPHLREGTTPMNAVLENTLSQLPADWYLQTPRSEERRVGKEGVSTCRSRWEQ